MTRRFVHLAAAVAVVLPSIVCAQQSSAPAAPRAADTGDVAARVGDRVITVGELDQAWREADAAAHAQAVQAMYDGRRQALDRLLADLLIERAAKAKGVSPEAFAKEEIGRRAKPIGDADVSAFYNQNAARMQGKPLDEVRGAIRSYLQQQRFAEARRALVSDLRRAAPEVRIALDPPRQHVTLGRTDPSRGAENASVVLVEYSDYQCPYCARVGPTLARLRQAYGDRVRFVWKDFPLTSIHPEAAKASEAAHCAGDQGKYWEYHDVLFANQRALQVEKLKGYARDLGLDAAAFGSCLDSGQHAGRVSAGLEEATALGLSSTPSIFINGRLVMGAQPFEVFQSVIDDELQRAATR